MPRELPANSPVTIQQLDEDTWIVKRHKEEARKLIVLAIPFIERLPDDPAWEKKEHAFAQAAVTGLAPFEE
jgi:hypothetical protein